MKVRATLIILICIFFVPQLVFASVKIYVFASANDPVGSQLVYKIRENLRVSKTFELTLHENDSGFQIRIVTLDPNDNGYQTVYSVVWTAKTNDSFLYWDQLVGICGLNRVSQVADQIVSKTDEMVIDLQRTLIDMLKTKHNK